ncbi:MAG: ribulose-phosphate 3-epimerase [Candidatus Pacebacteria bacterium]|nr:ribulose-phosphate 3-epimerase [Candidatus Paceibacterota bacterium]
MKRHTVHKKPLTTLPTDTVLVAPSILAADFAALGNEIERAENEGADIIHADVMDGHFVPNLTIGPPVVESIRKCSSLPYDVHLMLDEPENFIVPFAEAGADNLTVHVEIEANVHDVLGAIKEQGCSAGLSLRPGTDAERLVPFLSDVDLILVMTVEPGFGGQAFQPEMLSKIERIRDFIAEAGRPIHLEVDGGIDKTTAPQAIAHGANVLVAGTSIFRCKAGIRTAIKQLKA